MVNFRLKSTEHERGKCRLNAPRSRNNKNSILDSANPVISSLADSSSNQNNTYIIDYPQTKHIEDKVIILLVQGDGKAQI